MSSRVYRWPLTEFLAVLIGTACVVAGVVLIARAFGVALCELGTCGEVSEEERRDIHRGAVVGLILIGVSPLAVALVSRQRERRFVVLTAALGTAGGAAAYGLAAARNLPIGQVWFAAVVAAASFGGSVALRFASEGGLTIRLTLASVLSLSMVLSILFGLLVVFVYPAFALIGRLAPDGSSLGPGARPEAEP